MAGRRAIALGLGALVVSAPGLACGGGEQAGPPPAPGPAAGGGTTVAAEDFRFAPVTLTVKPGTTVVWKATGQAPHTVKGPGFQSKNIDPGGSFSHRFTKAGTFDYVCTLHIQQGMRGTVVVKP